MLKRLRFKNTTLEEQLSNEALPLRDKATGIPATTQREHSIREADITAHTAERLTSPGLQPPKC